MIAQLYSLAENPQPPPPSWDLYTRALLVSKDRRHFVTPCLSVSSSGNIGRLRKRDNLLTEERGRGCIQLRESLFLYKSYTTLWGALCRLWYPVKKISSISWTFFNHVFLMLEKSIAQTGNLFARSRKDFSPQRCFPRNSRCRSSNNKALNALEEKICIKKCCVLCTCSMQRQACTCSSFKFSISKNAKLLKVR